METEALAGSPSLGSELKVTPRRESSVGQLARGMTGGRTDSKSRGMPPETLGDFPRARSMASSNSCRQTRIQ